MTAVHEHSDHKAVCVHTVMVVCQRPKDGLKCPDEQYCVDDSLERKVADGIAIEPPRGDTGN